MAGMAAATPSSAPVEGTLGDQARAAVDAAIMCPVGRTLGLSAYIRTNDNVGIGPAAMATT